MYLIFSYFLTALAGITFTFITLSMMQVEEVTGQEVEEPVKTIVVRSYRRVIK